MTIVLTGGGSGGHITPLLAVAAELKRRQPQDRLVYVGQTGDSLADVPAASPFIDEVYGVRAGKFRRYHGEGWRQLLDLPTMALNVRDAGLVIVGLWQSYRLLKRVRPSVIFIKGGFVGVPVGLAAAWLHIPFVTHDSDAIPGLANRIIARWAQLHAVALPAELYAYPADRTVTTGVPVQADFQPVTAALQRRYRRDIGLPEQGRLVFVTGGGLGAHRVNDMVLAGARELLQRYPDLHLVHLVGRAHETSVRSAYEALLTPELLDRVVVKGFINDLYAYSGAADVIITRAGATTLAEFAVQAKPCIIVPNPLLTAGHQLKNAAYLAKTGAAVLVDEAAAHKQPAKLSQAVYDLLERPDKAATLGQALHGFAHADAAAKLAKLVLGVGKPHVRP